MTMIDPAIFVKVTGVGIVLATKGVHAVIERVTIPHIMIQNTDSGLVYQGPSTLIQALETIEHQAKEMP